MNKQKGFGSLLIVLVIAAIFIGIVAFMALRGDFSYIVPEPGGISVVQEEPGDTVVKKLQDVSSSDQVQALEADLDQTDLKALEQSLDQELEEIDNLLREIPF